MDFNNANTWSHDTDKMVVDASHLFVLPRRKLKEKPSPSKTEKRVRRAPEDVAVYLKSIQGALNARQLALRRWRRSNIRLAGYRILGQSLRGQVSCKIVDMIVELSHREGLG